MLEPAPFSFDSLGLALQGVAWGDPALPKVVMLHGFQDHGRSWDAVARILAADHHVLVPDQRGFGRSGWVGAGGSYQFHDYLLDLARLLDARGLERASLVGHSMGANVSGAFAGAFPDRVERVALVEGLGMPDIPPSEVPRRLRRFVEGTLAQADRSARPMASLDEAAERLRSQNPRLGHALSLHLARHGTRPHPESGLTWSFDPLHRAPMARPLRLDEWVALWAAMPGPVLLVQGACSPFVLPDLDRRLAALPGYEVVRIDDAGHNVHHDAPDALARALAAFLTTTR